MDTAAGWRSCSRSTTPSACRYPLARPIHHWDDVPKSSPPCTGPKREQPALTSSPAERPGPWSLERPAGADPAVGLRAEKFGTGVEDDGGPSGPTGERTSPADSSPEADP